MACQKEMVQEKAGEQTEKETLRAGKKINKNTN